MRAPTDANYHSLRELFATGTPVLRSSNHPDLEFDDREMADFQNLEPEAHDPADSPPTDQKDSPVVSFTCSEISKDDNIYARLLSEDRMPSKVRTSKQASLTRYTWCVFEIFKCSRDKTFNKSQIIDIVDSAGVCDPSKKDRQSMVKRLCRVLEVLIAIEVIEIDPTTREYKLLNNSKTKELLARPSDLYNHIRRKKELCSSVANKRELKEKLDKRIDALVKLIQRNKSNVSIGVINPGTLSKYETALISESTKISLQGEIIRIPASSKPRITISEDKKTIKLESKNPLPKPEAGWTILDKLNPMAWFQFSKCLIDGIVNGGKTKK